MFDNSLNWGFFFEIRNNLFKTVPIETSACHILCAAIISTFNNDNRESCICENNRCRASGKSATHDDNVGVKFSLAHLYPPYCIKPKVNIYFFYFYFCPQTRTHAPHILFLWFTALNPSLRYKSSSSPR